MLDSSAASQARVAIDAMTGGMTLFGSRWIPRYLDTDPPVAAVGWMEHEAAEAGLFLLCGMANIFYFRARPFFEIASGGS